MSLQFLKKEGKFFLNCFSKINGQQLLDDVEGNKNWEIWNEENGHIALVTKGTMFKKDLKIPKKIKEHPSVSQSILSKVLDQGMITVKERE